jgi:hypothetical protein
MTGCNCMVCDLSMLLVMQLTTSLLLQRQHGASMLKPRQVYRF